MAETDCSQCVGLLCLRGTREGAWQPAELGDVLRHGLETRVGEYLEIGGPAAGFAADSPSERADAVQTLRELFQAAHPPLGPLIAVKRHARGMAGSEMSSMPAEVHRHVYFACIAAAKVRHGERISKSPPDVLCTGLRLLMAEPYVDDWLRVLFARALQRFS